MKDNSSRRAREQFGDWLDVTLSNAGILGRTLAEHLGIHESAVSRLRNGTSAPSAETLEGIAGYLDLDSARLAVTSGLVSSSMAGGAKPYPMPEPTAQRESVRRQITRIKGLSDETRGRLLDTYEELIAEE